MNQVTQYDLFPAASQWPKPTVLDCAHCGCQVGNDFEVIQKHVAWHNLIAEIGGAR